MFPRKLSGSETGLGNTSKQVNNQSQPRTCPKWVGVGGKGRNWGGHGEINQMATRCRWYIWGLATNERGGSELKGGSGKV